MNYPKQRKPRNSAPRVQHHRLPINEQLALMVQDWRTIAQQYRAQEGVQGDVELTVTRDRLASAQRLECFADRLEAIIPTKDDTARAGCSLVVGNRPFPTRMAMNIYLNGR